MLVGERPAHRNFEAVLAGALDQRGEQSFDVAPATGAVRAERVDQDAGHASFPRWVPSGSVLRPERAAPFGPTIQQAEGAIISGGGADSGLAHEKVEPTGGERGECGDA